MERVCLRSAYEQICGADYLCRCAESDLLYVRMEGVPKREAASSNLQKENHGDDFLID
jgi:hypothetical protein